VNRIRSVALLSGVALLAAVLSAPPAVADRYTESDPAFDMGMYLYVYPGPPEKVSAAPAHHKLDIRRVFVRHTPRFVTIRVVTRALTRPRGDESFGLNGYIKVKRGAQSPVPAWYWNATFDERHRHEATNLWVLDAAEGEQYGCVADTDKGLNATAHYDGNWVTVTIPRHCLNLDYINFLPPWVKVSVTTWHGLGPDRPSYFDHLGSHVLNPFPNEENSHFTPRLYPG
jgi:hypothetical protein